MTTSDAPLAVFTKWHLLDTGYCLTLESALFRSGRWKPVHCHVTVALLHHPTQGWILWDTGYAPRILAETRRFPFRLYRMVTPIRHREELSVAAHLPRFGLDCQDIRWVILSHLH